MNDVRKQWRAEEKNGKGKKAKELKKSEAAILFVTSA
jgi:hypothetical protein